MSNDPEEPRPPDNDPEPIFYDQPPAEKPKLRLSRDSTPPAPFPDALTEEEFEDDEAPSALRNGAVTLINLALRFKWMLLICCMIGGCKLSCIKQDIDYRDKRFKEGMTAILSGMNTKSTEQLKDGLSSYTIFFDDYSASRQKKIINQYAEQLAPFMTREFVEENPEWVGQRRWVDFLNNHADPEVVAHAQAAHASFAQERREVAAQKEAARLNQRALEMEYSIVLRQAYPRQFAEAFKRHGFTGRAEGKFRNIFSPLPVLVLEEDERRSPDALAYVLVGYEVDVAVGYQGGVKDEELVGIRLSTSYSTNLKESFSDEQKYFGGMDQREIRGTEAELQSMINRFASTASGEMGTYLATLRLDPETRQALQEKAAAAKARQAATVAEPVETP